LCPGVNVEKEANGMKNKNMDDSFPHQRADGDCTRAFWFIALISLGLLGVAIGSFNMFVS